MTVTQVAPQQGTWTAEAVNKALWNHFVSGGWHLLFEVTAPGDSTVPYGHPARTDRRIDVLMIRKARRMGIGLFELLAVEVKVTRSDFLSDVRQPEKQAPWRQLAHRHAYAVPDGLVRPEEVPAGSGLIVVETREGRGGVAHPVKFALRAPYEGNRPEFPTWLTNTLIARTSWAEARLKGWSGVHTYDTGEDTVEELRGKLEAARKEANRVATRLNTITRERDAWREAYSVGNTVHCSFCRERIKPARFSRRNSSYLQAWVHADKTHEQVCEVAREAAAVDESRAWWEAATDEVKQRERSIYSYRGDMTDEQIIQRRALTSLVTPADDNTPEDTP